MKPKMLALAPLILLLTACSIHTPPNATYISTYDLLADVRPAPLGPKSFLSNLKWFAEETDNRLSLTFRTMPKDQSEAEYVALTQIVGSDNKVASFPSARRTFFRLQLPESDAISQVTYQSDGLSAQTSSAKLSIALPLHRFGAIIDAAPRNPGQRTELLIDSSRILGSRLVTDAPLVFHVESNRMTWTDGNYTLVFRHNGAVTQLAQNRFSIKSIDPNPLHLAVTFHMNAGNAHDDAEDLFANSRDVIGRSHNEWATYLASCPITHFPNGYHAHDPVTGGGNRDLNFTDTELETRQLWHWQAALANCYDIDFNNMPAQLCPDKTTWFGAWSNDTPAALAALSHTNQHDLARRALINYVRVGITPDGDLTWYMHGTGVKGLGNPRDVGRISHGVPEIVSAINDYVQTTNDDSILTAPAGDGMTVWQKLRTYVTAVFRRRPTSPDGLVAWANLWEGGADDKVGPFFSKADIGAWCKAVENMNDADLKNFYAENDRPVVNLYEQAFFLNALQAMQNLADRAHDPDSAQFAKEKFHHIAQVLHDKNWDDTDGFYYDYDLTTQKLVHVKNQDAFYLFRYLPNDSTTPARTQKLLAHLHNPDEFALPFLPTLAKNDPGFKPDGYWCGGYWPRESAPIARSLAAIGHKDEAELLLIKALMSATGKVILENVNPITGQPSTPIKTMAYSVQLNLALHDIHTK